MIKSFEINNFRCFHKTKAKGFTRINLLGGQNNAGKTALLEALLLMGEPSNQSIGQLLRFRRFNPNLAKEMPEKTWENFFFQQQKSNIISFSFILSDNDQLNKVLLSSEDIVSDAPFFPQNENDNGDKIDVWGSLMKETKSILHINSYTGDNQLQTNFFESRTNGTFGSGLPHTFIAVCFVPATLKLSSNELAREFDKAKFDGKADELLKAFRLIDNNIEKVETLAIGKTELYLKRVDEKKYMPLSLFGDAMNKIAEFILGIVNNPNCILLIDEIENGIHFENQEEIWKVLFDLCKEYNVQLFATSHSGEMIEAFKNVIVKNNREEEGAYFEMGRHVKTNEIVIQKIPIDSLEDKLNNQYPIRGEKINNRRAIA